MNIRTFNAFLRKEIIESVRQYKYIVLAVGILLFAMLDPILLKLMPAMLKSQLKADLSQLMIVDPFKAVQNYIKDLFQVGILFVIFSSSGTANEELHTEKLIFPYSKGASPVQIIFAKYINYLIAIIILTFIGFFINYYYVSLLFSGLMPTIPMILNAALCMILYYAFYLAVSILFSTIFRKGITAGIVALLLNYLLALASQLQYLSSYLPQNLVSAANSFSFSDFEWTIIFMLIFTLIILALSSVKFKSSEAF